MTDPGLPDGVAQRGAHGLLADELAEGLGAVLAVQRLEGHGPPTLSGAYDMKRRPCTRRRSGSFRLKSVARSGQATLRHTGWSAESCFLPDLTRFAGPRCAGPGLRHCVRTELLKLVGPRAGIQPPIRGFGVQGTTSSPPSTVRGHASVAA